MTDSNDLLNFEEFALLLCSAKAAGATALALTVHDLDTNDVIQHMMDEDYLEEILILTPAHFPLSEIAVYNPLQNQFQRNKPFVTTKVPLPKNVRSKVQHRLPRRFGR